MSTKHEKDKPFVTSFPLVLDTLISNISSCRWDTEDINKWEIPTFKREDNVGGTFTEESTFTVLFPKYREVYLREAVGSTKILVIRPPH